MKTFNYSHKTQRAESTVWHFICSHSTCPNVTDLLDSPVEDALVEDLGGGWGPDCPDELVGVCVGPGTGAGDEWLVWTAWDMRTDNGTSDQRGRAHQ